MPSLSSPLGLAAKLRKPSMHLDATAIGTVLILALMLTLLVGSRFVYAPGITVGVSEDGARATLELPVAEGARLDGAMTTDTVTIVALKEDDLVIWDGRIRRISDLEKEFAAARPETNRGTLLIKADKGVTMQTFYQVVGIARRAGFSAVHLAGENARR